MINFSDKYYINLHHLKLYKPSKRKQKKLNCLLKDYAIRSALKIVKHWGLINYTKSHDHTYYVARNNFKIANRIVGITDEYNAVIMLENLKKYQKEYNKLLYT